MRQQLEEMRTEREAWVARVHDSTLSQLSFILIPLKQCLQTLYQERLHQIVLFGSYARQDATVDSDIDVLIVLADPVDTSAEICQTSEFVAQLCLEHNLLVSRLFLSTSRYKTEQSPLLKNIRQEGIVV